MYEYSPSLLPTKRQVTLYDQCLCRLYAQLSDASNTRLRFV